MTGVSSFATHTVVSRRSLVKVEHDVPLVIAALMGCAVLTGAGAVFNMGAVQPGSRTAVVGLGGVGLAAVLLGAAAARARRSSRSIPLRRSWSLQRGSARRIASMPPIPT